MDAWTTVNIAPLPRNENSANAVPRGIPMTALMRAANPDTTIDSQRARYTCEIVIIAYHRLAAASFARATEGNQGSSYLGGPGFVTLQ